MLFLFIDSLNMLYIEIIGIDVSVRTFSIKISKQFQACDHGALSLLCVIVLELEWNSFIC